ncbi:MAG: hypothetical protein IJC93_06570 [Clostridia bacterium]|nr:hypothetical protein [Clostridia bacterium]
MLEKARRLHVAESAALFVEGDRTAQIFVIVHVVGRGEDIGVGEEIGRELVRFRGDGIDHVPAERTGAAENVGGIKFIAVFKGFDRAVGGGDLLGQIGR